MAIALAVLLTNPVLCNRAAAQDFDLAIDLRVIGSNAAPARGTGGLGVLRFDDDHDGLRLGYVRASYRADPTDQIQLAADAVAYGDKDANPVDLIDAWAGWRSLPYDGWRSRLKLGAFYPEISLENRTRGWFSPYSLSFSALNTWVGEELRTIGAEYALDWLGQQQGARWNFTLNGALYGWNDPAGTVLATRGWGISDRQSTLFGRFAYRGRPLRERTLFYDDMDKRAGYYVGVAANYTGTLQFNALHYDNRANAAIYSERIEDVAWLTRFKSYGLRWTPDEAWTVIAQRLDGETYAGEYNANEFGYWADFLLASYQFGRNRFTARYDRFYMEQETSTYGFYAEDEGHAWTLAWLRTLGRHWNAALEYVVADSAMNAREARLGTPEQATERQLQLALRFEL